MTAQKRTAVVVRHFPETGRLSGLVSFARVLVSALGNTREVTVFSGDAEVRRLNQPFLHHRVSAPFWLNVWRAIDSSTHDRVIVLSGIHGPQWAPWLALCMHICAIPNNKRLWVQATTLDKPWSRRQAKLLRGSARIGTLNPLQAESLRGVVPDLVVATPGIELQRIRSITPVARATPGKVRVGFFGHYNAVKGADRIPAIIDRLRSTRWELVIAGTGALKPELREWAATRDGVEVHGYLHDPIPLLASCDVLLAPFRQSATILGLSQVVIEAMALGIPVVGTATDAVAGVVSHEVEGLLASSDEGMASALDRLVQDDALRSRMAAAARGCADQFAIERVVSMLDDALDNTSGNFTGTTIP